MLSSCKVNVRTVVLCVVELQRVTPAFTCFLLSLNNFATTYKSLHTRRIGRARIIPRSPADRSRIERASAAGWRWVGPVGCPVCPLTARLRAEERERPERDFPRKRIRWGMPMKGVVCPRPDTPGTPKFRGGMPVLVWSPVGHRPGGYRAKRGFGGRVGMKG